MSAIEYVKTLELGEDAVVVMRVLGTPTMGYLRAWQEQLRDACPRNRILVLGVEGLEVDAIKPAALEALERAIVTSAGLVELEQTQALEQLLEALKPDALDDHDRPF